MLTKWIMNSFQPLQSSLNIYTNLPAGGSIQKINSNMYVQMVRPNKNTVGVVNIKMTLPHRNT